MSDGEETDAVHQVEAILGELLGIAEKVMMSRARLHSTCLKWSKVSKRTLVSLQQICYQIQQHNLNCNIASLTGSSTATLGAVFSIIGMVFAIPTAGLSLAFNVGGAVTAAVGGAVSIGSAITKHVLSNQQYEEAIGVLTENVTVTESFEKKRGVYTDLLRKFDAKLEELVALFKIPGAVDIFLEYFRDGNFKNIFAAKLMEMIHTQPSKEHTSILIRVETLFIVVQRDPFLLQLWKDAICEAMKKAAIDTSFRNVYASRGLLPKAEEFNCSERPSVYTSYIAPTVAVATTAIKLIDTLDEPLKAISIAANVAMRAFNFLLVVWGVVDIVKTSVDIYNGSESSHTKELLRAAEEIKERREQIIESMTSIFSWHLTE